MRSLARWAVVLPVSAIFPAVLTVFVSLMVLAAVLVYAGKHSDFTPSPIRSDGAFSDARE